MKNQIVNLPPRNQSSFLPFEPTNRRIKVSLHQLINDLLPSLQPLALHRNNIIYNGVPKGLCFIAEENILAFNIWNKLGNVVHNKRNESIHVHALVDDDHTTIAFKDATDGVQLAFSILNTRLAV